MKILITGARGFIGKNLIAELYNIKGKKTNRYQGIDPDTLEILPFDVDTDPSLLETYTQECDFVFHLAGVNRPKDPAEYKAGNFGFTNTLLDLLKKADNKAPVMLASSIQATLDVAAGKQFCTVPVSYKVKLGDVAELIQSFREDREKLQVPDMSDAFTKKLYATYLSYLPTDQFSYPLKMNVDSRGSFTEFIRTPDRGQVSINISKPGITKGQHWHHTKNEKFLVVRGKGQIQFRKVINDQEDGEKMKRESVISYHVTGDKLEVIDIPTVYTHNIINEGEEDMITVMWASEAFDPKKPDTYFLEV